jgi:hypothetical protein
MGLFSFLKSDKQTYTDKVWKTRPVAIKGMITQALVSIKQGQVPIVFCYFDDTIGEVISFLEQAGVPYFNLKNDTYHEAAGQHKVVFIGDASQVLSSHTLISFLRTISTSTHLHILFSGHYPLPSKEKKILDKLAALFPQAPVIFCSSIDDPSFELFGADRITNLLEKLGMKDDECIEHSLVTKSMVRAREKIESRVKSEIETKSEGDWFVKNVKKES